LGNNGLTEEELAPRRLVNDVSIRHAEHLHDAGQLFMLVLSGEDRHSGVKLGEDATDYSSALLIAPI
jgi:hypothetical protein